MLVLTWNLFHGRARPGAGRSLEREFADALRGWDWDVALLQEVPPWWGPMLGRACEAHARTVLTSRNEGLFVRRWIAERWPDLIKANGGGANVLLVRGAAPARHETLRLRWRPERRCVHAVRLGDRWVANLHAQGQNPLARADLDKAARWLDGLRDGAPAVLGGDLNLRAPAAAGYAVLGGTHVDWLLGDGIERAGDVEVLDRGVLSDHAPVRLRVREPRAT